MAGKRSRRLAARARGHQLACAACNRIFVVCRPCFRGQRYCSRECAYRRRARRQRVAARRYASSERGREMARLRQARHRARTPKKVNAEGVTHHRLTLQSPATLGIDGTILQSPDGNRRSIQVEGGVVVARYRSRPHRTPRFKCCSACRSRVRWLSARPPDLRKVFYLRHFGVPNPYASRSQT